MTHPLPPLSTDRPRIAAAAALCLLLALVASVTLGPQLALWTSGPAWLLLAAASLLALPLAGRLPAAVGWTGLPLVGWLAWRAWTSPVAEFAIADGMLLVGAVAVFAIARGLLPRRGAVELLFTGLGVLVLANWLPMIHQAKDPAYVLWLPRGTDSYPSGFFGYYGDCAAFLLAMALLAGGLVWDSRRATWFRVFMAVVALAAAGGVMFTRARGGILGLGAGGATMMALAPWLLLDRRSRWRGVVALAIPLAVVAGIIALESGISAAQEARGPNGAAPGDLGDNSARLFWWQMAVSCIASHPLAGGGSRSFSWESLHFWSADWDKFSAAKPEFAHNEFLQLTSDYGIVGLILLVVFLGSTVVAGIVARWNGGEAKAATAVFLGGCAAVAGLLVHAQFHFVFHVPPQAMLLGLGLACILAPADAERSGTRSIFGPVRFVVPVACAACLAWFGARGAMAFRELWPLHYRFGQEVPELAEAVARTDRAARAWPSAERHLAHGKLTALAAESATGADRILLLESAAEAFGEALRFHPLSAEASVNRANMLSRLGRDDSSEHEYERAIQLQGGAERGARARLFASDHFSRKAERLRQAGELDEALDALIRARDIFDEAASASVWEYGGDGRAYRLALAQQLGPWLEAEARHADAAAEYDRAVQIPGGRPLHFFAARNLFAWGDALWSERKPEEALAKFLEARGRLIAAAGQAPAGFRVQDLVALGERVKGKIAFLEEARVKPAR